MGSLICTRKPMVTSRGSRSAKPTRVLVAAHMDEIGFYVRHVDDNGFLWLNAAGGFDTRNLFSKRVLVVTEHGDFKGMMNPGGKPIHISSEAERTKVPGVEEFFVDLGRDAADVKKLVQIGDYVVMDEPFLETPRTVVSKALDNRFAVFVAIEAIRALAKQKRGGHRCEVVVAFTHPRGSRPPRGHHGGERGRRRHRHRPRREPGLRHPRRSRHPAGDEAGPRRRDHGPGRLDDL
jgi:putative aminopeptidase FrvX